MILLVTSIDVYSKFLLRSDLDVLDQQGRIDLIKLELKSQDKQAEPNIGQMFVTAVKNISTRLRKDTQQTETTSPIHQTRNPRPDST